MSDKKRKRKNDDNSGIEQLMGCSYFLLKVIAGVLSLIFMTLALVLVYIQMLYALDLAVFVAIAGLFSYLSGYFALSQDETQSVDSEHLRDTLEEDKRKNDWLDDDEYED